MDLNIHSSDKVLSAQEREEFRILSEETIRDFSESIDGFGEIIKEYQPSQNKVHDQITKTILDIGIYTFYTYCDCTVLLKHFILSTDLYEKSFFRGKIKVLLNEGFKRLYGFNENQQEQSYFAKLDKIIHHFPGFKSEYGSILSDLRDFSEQSSWWRDERNIEVHLDMSQLYKIRHEEINERKEAMEAQLLMSLLVQINKLMGRMNQTYISYMSEHLKVE
jgi:hypothetical protein